MFICTAPSPIYFDCKPVPEWRFKPRSNDFFHQLDELLTEVEEHTTDLIEYNLGIYSPENRKVRKMEKALIDLFDNGKIDYWQFEYLNQNIRNLTYEQEVETTNMGVIMINRIYVGNVLISEFKE